MLKRFMKCMLRPKKAEPLPEQKMFLWNDPITCGGCGKKIQAEVYAVDGIVTEQHQCEICQYVNINWSENGEGRDDETNEGIRRAIARATERSDKRGD